MPNFATKRKTQEHTLTPSAAVLEKITPDVAIKTYTVATRGGLDLLKVGNKHFQIIDRRTREVLVDDLTSREECFVALGLAGKVSHQEFAMHPQAVLPEQK
jgi:hypothetical protein